MDKAIDTPIVIVLHRLKNSESNFESILQLNTHYTVKEIEDKEVIKKECCIPHHQTTTFCWRTTEPSLDVSEVVNFSRPSIDVLFESFHLLYKKMFGYSLSGSNNDGAKEV
jgi:two-component system chemotaxis response regulator CheB